ncbi:C40 family peptidase [Desulfolucanica intricata]|uniref:C40 family peptidase n=1 Tax=Desulfolucanica intricata TaxID=1285191 RepID=UPI00082F09F1|nr:NlpC/P60 family protein [Desulfolucanica intricata]
MNKVSKILTITFAFLAITLFSVATAQASQPVLKQGMTGDSVLMLQKQLQAYGYNTGGLDGIFGPMTRQAVAKFQADRGLIVDGIAGPQTFSALYNGTSYSRNLTGVRQGIVNTARNLLGRPYAWSGSTPSGFDCSGFTYYVMRQHGISLPRTSFAQFGAGVSTSQPQPGDLVFFTTYQAGASHVGIYIGSGQFIHCSSARGQVMTSSLSDSYYKARYLGARSFVRA